MSVELYIHLGLHRTGTTFLQHKVFPRLNDIMFFKELTFKTLICKSRKNLVSNEDLSGTPFNPNSNPNDRFMIADNIFKVYPEAKIILGLREKNSWMKSLYNQYLKIGGTSSFNQFKNEEFNKKYLDFNQYVEFLKDTFDDVFIYHFEDLKQNNERVVKDLCSFLHVNVPSYKNRRYNTSWSFFQKRLALIINNLWSIYNLPYHIQLKPTIPRMIVDLSSPRFVISQIEKKKSQKKMKMSKRY